MPIYTRRWDDPPREGEGLKILVTRYRPRGLAKADETWDQLMPNLGPSTQLHAAVYGKTGTGMQWPVYRARYLSEMLSQRRAIHDLARRVANGETLTLLCSSQCTRESRCHRSLPRELIEAEVARLGKTDREKADGSSVSEM